MQVSLPAQPFLFLWYHVLSFPDMCHIQIPKCFRLFQTSVPPSRLFPLLGTPFHLPNLDSQLSSISVSIKVRSPGSSLCTLLSHYLSHFGSATEYTSLKERTGPIHLGMYVPNKMPGTWFVLNKHIMGMNESVNKSVTEWLIFW